MLPVKNRLKKEKDIKRVFKKGRGITEKFLFLKEINNNLNYSRFGIVVGQKVAKKAAIRNKIKRRLREVIKLNLNQIKPGRDIIVIAKFDCALKNFKEIKKTLRYLFKKAKLLKPKFQLPLK